MTGLRCLQNFDDVAVRIAAIGKDAATRHGKWRSVELDTRITQSEMFGMAVGNLKADMTKSRFGDASKLRRGVDGWFGKFKQFQARVGEADHDEPAATALEAKPCRKRDIGSVPGEGMENLAAEELHVEVGKPVEIASRDSCVVQRDDHDEDLTRVA